MDKALLIIIVPITLLIILLCVFVVPHFIKNAQEHDELRYMNCSDPEAILDWADRHTSWIDHQAYARSLYLSCVHGDPRPILNH